MDIAILGNPNTGKTSLFNQLTHSYEYVGNWSGVTVEKKVGKLRAATGNLIDLPGLYTLSPLTKDEKVASTFLLEGKFDGMINIIDSSQLERNLHLTVQLLEYGKPMMIGLNMMDVAKRNGLAIHIHQLSQQLGVPIKPMIARKGKGCEQLDAEKMKAPSFHLQYDDIIEEAIQQCESQMPAKMKHTRWIALQYLEGNEVVQQYLQQYVSLTWLEAWMKDTEKNVKIKHNIALNKLIYRTRETYIEELLKENMITSLLKHKASSETIDRVVTNRILGIPIFLFVMYVMFQFTFDWLGVPISDLVDGLISGPVTSGVEAGLQWIGANAFFQSLFIDGIIAGVGGVLVFVPQIFILFLFISFIEDSGYMARVAMVMDRLLEKFGLNGKAFIPMIIGFGCNVPGIMASRSMEQEQERHLTTMLTPFMSCSARLAVYSLFTAIFFTSHQALIVLSLYVMGIVVALIVAKILSITKYKNEKSLFVIELPPYRIPYAKTLYRSTWEKGKGFVRKAGTIILAGTIVIWLLSYVGPQGFHVPIQESFMAYVGKSIAPLLSPLGFDTWQAGAALITGFLAKEMVVSTLYVLYLVPNTEALHVVIGQQYTALQSYSFMVFFLLYVPCLATVATLKNELPNTRSMLFSIALSFAIAYVLALCVYQIGRLLGF